MITEIESHFESHFENFDGVIVYGDTDSTLAGAIWAKRKGFRVIHVESGLRSGNQVMPEELNRILVDHISDLHLAPSAAAMRNLEQEGLSDSAKLVGDIMLDHLIQHKVSENFFDFLLQYGVSEGNKYFVVSFHRNETVNSESKLSEIVENINLASETTFVLGHPKLVECLNRFGLRLSGKAKLLNPLSHRDLLSLIKLSSGVMTDSGGLQRESAVLGIPTLICREETEWLELLDFKNVLLSSNSFDWDKNLSKLPTEITRGVNLGFAAETSSRAILEFLERK